MHQPQESQLISNEFQNSNGERFLRYNLETILRKYNKHMNLATFNLFHLGPTYKVFASFNIVLMVAILALSILGIRVWTHPNYPDKVDNLNLNDDKRKLSKLVIDRQNQPPQSINKVVSNNLFRKERAEYIPPPPPSPVKNQITQNLLPSPELVLRGVMLLNGTKIAILEGSYSEMRGNKIEKNNIKRKGYYLGDQISNYTISHIEKRTVTLNSHSGQTLRVKLIRQVPNMNKSQKKKSPKIISTRKSTKKKLQPTQRISGAITAPLPKHISGR